MQRPYLGTLVTLVGATLFSVWLLFPTYLFYWTATPEQRADNKLFCASVPSWSHCNKMTLGLDLQGGLHLVMGVVVNKAVSDRAERYADGLTDRFKEKQIDVESVKHLDDSPTIEIVLKDTETEKKMTDYIRSDFNVLTVSERLDGGKRVRLSIIEDEQTRIKADAVDQAIKTIRNRADKYGVSEPTIAKRGEDNILIQLPGVKDPDRAIELIGTTAQLEFNIVDDEGTALDNLELPEGVTRDYEGGAGGRRVTVLHAATKEAIYEAVKGKLPEDRTVKVGEEEDAAGKVIGYRSYLVAKKAGVTGDYLTDAGVQFSQEEGRHHVSFEFDPQGAKIFEKLTGENIGKRLAVVLDDTIKSAPVIQSKISNQGRITMGGNKSSDEIMNEAKDLALVLKSGALAAPVIIREQRRVGATLGSEAVQKGQQAMMIGLILVVLAMVAYYRLSGAIANFALIFNFVFIIAALAGLEATLTLPGMAGIALTLGMAVDANVIILERIREEIRHGKTVRAAVEAGYDRAFWTIVDSHVTQVVAGVILWQYGSGPIRGFATTLIIGIIASLYTSVWVTKMIYDWMGAKTKMETISI
jgi:preprotein translocase subunit SecD